MSTQNARRRYRPADLFLLWSRSGGLCAFPDCGTYCAVEANNNDLSALIGHIAHIEASSDAGPRANPSLSSRERDAYDNLILLCATHHVLVDAQDSTYTVEMLREWKQVQEAWHVELVHRTVPHITFAELEVVTNAIVDGQQPIAFSIDLIPLQDKMDQNGLTERSNHLFNMGMIQNQLVRRFVERMGSIDRGFVGRLISGFVDEYQRQRREGLGGDALFAALYHFSAQGRVDIRYRSAGLAVVVYLFERCEVFER